MLVSDHECLCDNYNFGCLGASFGLPPQTGVAEQKVVVVSVSPQSRASLAARYDLSSTEAGRKLTCFFKGLGECKYESCEREVHLGSHFWRLLSLLQGSIMFLTQALVGRSACWKARESLWNVSRGRSRIVHVCPWWLQPVQVFHYKHYFYTYFDFYNAKFHDLLISYIIVKRYHHYLFTHSCVCVCVVFRLDLLRREDTWRVRSSVHQYHSLPSADDGFSG